ncbi:MAG: rhamnan synthesis F family protein [Paracoccaceae bacterium]
MRRRSYDKKRAKLIKYTDGARALKSNVAILLIYQADGLLPSLFTELDHLWAQGVSTIVVSNAPISPQDRAKLQSHCHLILERPNYGYDFGGYRDGVLTLFERGISPDNLFILNDSIWFPLTDDCTLIESAIANEADLFGISYNDRSHDIYNQHIQSYFYRFKKRVIDSSHFEEHWRNLLLTNNKLMVVNQCEKKLTYAMTSKGFTVDFMFDTKDLRRYAAQLDDADLRDFLYYCTQTNTHIADALQPFIDAQENNRDWRQGLEKFILSGGLGDYLLIMHPLILLRSMRTPVLKKDRQYIYQLQRKEIFRCGLDSKMTPIIRDEIAQWDRPKVLA